MAAAASSASSMGPAAAFRPERNVVHVARVPGAHRRVGGSDAVADPESESTVMAPTHQDVVTRALVEVPEDAMQQGGRWRSLSDAGVTW